MNDVVRLGLPKGRMQDALFRLLTDAGLPVRTVVQAVRDPDDILARVRIKPRASLAQDRQVMALWFNPANPAAHVNPALERDLPEDTLANT